MTAFAVFAAAYAAYVWSCPPSLAAYRDSGEMAAGVWSLGVLHPTSYPLYSLAGKAWLSLPFTGGDPAHRLALFSALCAALAVAGVFELARRRFGTAAGFAAALLLFFNPTFWSVAVVQEMYALWILLAVALLACALWVRDAAADDGHPHRPKPADLTPRAARACAFAFLFGLALANRLDLLLWAPGLLWLAFSKPGQRGAVWAGLALLATPAAMLALSSNAPMALLVVGTALWLGAGRPKIAAFGLLGLSVYLFLPVRSASGPWLDWNHPASLSNFLDSLLRTRYGGTLDLLSKSYAKGELFDENMRLYAKHLWDAFSVPGLAAAAFGVWTAARREPNRALALGAVYLMSGPIFLLLANMPPNPHAIAIVEPHYLLSDLALVLFAAEGVSAAPVPAAWAAAVLAFAIPLVRGVPASETRRRHYEAPDFARNALLSAPKGATLVAKKDVPLYSLWYETVARGRRPDVKVVAQGLAGARWYGGVSLRDDAGWRALVRPYATADAEVPSAVSAGFKPRGLLFGEERADWPWELVARRQDYAYDDAPDFFSGDLVAEYAQALLRLGGPDALLRAWALQWGFPEAPAHLAFLAFQAKNWAEAARLYDLSLRAADRLIELAREYRSLPEAKKLVQRQSAELLTHRGVAAERLGRREEAAGFYEAAILRYPLAQAHFNYAVLLWGRDWERAASLLEMTLRLEPGHAEAARYLPIARSRARKGA